MQASKNKGKRQGPPQMTITRHYTTMTEKETDEVVELMADLIVNFIKNSDPVPPKNNPANSEETPTGREDAGEHQPKSPTSR